MFELFLSFNFVLLIYAVGCFGQGSACERREVRDGCTVEGGFAQCEGWDLMQGIPGLPACTTRITVSLYKSPSLTEEQTWLNLHPTKFSHMTNLRELTIQTERDNYPYIRILTPTLQGFPNVTTLRIRAQQYEFPDHDHESGMYSNIQSLEVLDLSRAKRLGLSLVQHKIAKQSSIRVLVLKNIQEMNRKRTYAADLDLGHFICGGSVEYLDLSYNDIAYLNLTQQTCSSRMKHLNLDHNILIALDDPHSMFMSALVMFPAMETFSFCSAWESDVYQEGLWGDAVIPGVSHEDSKETVSPLDRGTLPQKFSIFEALAKYHVWFQDILHKCGNFGYLAVANCLVGVQDICSLIACLSPELDLTSCPTDSLRNQLEYFGQKMCPYHHCFVNVPFPLPPNLKSLKAHDTGKYSNFHAILSANITNMCVHPHNKLEYVDISNLNFGFLRKYPGSFSITGLTKLKYLNIQGCQLVLSKYQLLSADMHALEELHIGGNEIGDVLPADLLHTYTKLAILNLSNANLVDIEPNAFLNHKSLSVLDLSHNHLISSSLAALDLSETSMRLLNLSHNRLADIPASLRHQLDRMHLLELDLSRNTFICSCDNLAFLQWIQTGSSIVFHYAGDHVCADSPGDTIHNIEVDSLACNAYWVRPVIAVASTVAVALLVLGILATYRKRWFIWNLLFRLQERFCVRSEGDTNVSYTFDALILYDDEGEDRQWVHLKLVPELEQQYGFRLCFEHRDFPAGVEDPGRPIQRAINLSRKVIVVMSKNFLTNTGRMCRDGVLRTYNTDTKKFIVIMYKDINSPAPIPEVLRDVLQTAPHIDWATERQAQKLFWKKLRRALHSRQQSSDDAATHVWDTTQSHCDSLV